jgi:Raf kinase inhibitor-like YbhB/YbcL family protein
MVAAQGAKRMRRLFAAVTFFAAALIATTAAACAGGFSLSANALHEGGPIPRLYVYDGCNGLNRSPELSWSGLPAGTKSFAVTVFDPDAPQAGGWWHWVVYDIPATTRGLPENASAKALPQNAKQTQNDFGTPGYGGPCPPPGKVHRYVFTVYALKVVQLAVNGPPAKTAEAIRRNALASASLTARYGR